MSNAAANRRGILALTGSCACFCANDACTKLAAATLPSTEFVLIRGALTFLFILGIIALRGELMHLRRAAQPLLIVRSVFEAFAGLSFVIALGVMPIANATAIFLVAPFLMTVAAALLLKESVNWRRWAAVIVGFVGVLLVVQPATDEFNVASLLVLGSAVLIIARDFLTRRIQAAMPTTVVTVWTSVASIAIGLLGATAEQWVVPDAFALAMTVSAALLLVFGYMLGVIAFRGTEASAVGPYRYSIVPFALFFGIVLFGDFPNALAITGTVIIVVAGVYMARSEAMRGARVARPVQA